MMERLTFDGNFCDIAQCKEFPCPYNGSCSQREVWEKLKAYEATGLEPEVCVNYKAFEDEAISKGVTFKRIVALMEADSTGRCGRTGSAKPYMFFFRMVRFSTQKQTAGISVKK